MVLALVFVFVFGIAPESVPRGLTRMMATAIDSSRPQVSQGL